MRPLALLAGLAFAAGCSSANTSNPDGGDPGSDGGAADAGAPDASCSTPAEAIEAVETLCDGIDNDCNGIVDDVANLTPWFRDGDGDGFGAGVAARFGCAQPEGFVASSSDCNDNDLVVNPDATERCDGVDTDCDATTTEACGHGCQPILRFEDRHIYLFCTEAQGWIAARSICREEGYDLAIVNDPFENDWIRRTADGINVESWWIGASDQTTEGTWTWIGGAPFWQGAANGAPVADSFAKWQRNEPNDDGDENCGEIVKAETGAWNDNKCGHPEKFICERPAPP
jgi:hypothetical protein